VAAGSAWRTAPARSAPAPPLAPPRICGAWAPRNTELSCAYWAKERILQALADSDAIGQDFSVTGPLFQYLRPSCATYLPPSCTLIQPIRRILADVKAGELTCNLHAISHGPHMSTYAHVPCTHASMTTQARTIVPSHRAQPITQSCLRRSLPAQGATCEHPPTLTSPSPHPPPPQVGHTLAAPQGEAGLQWLLHALGHLHL
jgi:hypothetical protein